ncbi:tRNA lysidine(34) synthetase TilS [Bradymonadaceae bacterium TMQ3]|uniref:tRNA(Ile)-lysidine synthase n=1 Tax=Lujinxingia sediminis TaxID=2480984 RepID=A0ABY0CSM4_9DELT|nr:tRNA lysidine(34) synthetase TilS [Lujinxingia sediminis]RDV38854.1 tRNA lysidine(34) synthetase TilS [Bradymonadaceae bacterium TMQ3]RVU44088.1 tRNA lysidine(34) synthetase TilS [Lujinxingia sediminis]TXC76374.1 tRNA lysidine(34) synthetase TilS [Bradymonadales bacterium TMQ1]
MPTPPTASEDTLLEGVQNALEHADIRRGDRLVVAWSGGRDSTVLLDLLQRLAPGLHLHLIAAHVDHAMRESSSRDAEHCEAWARTSGIQLERVTLSPGQASNQADARQARYQALGAIAQTHRASALLTAHHGDDRLESALINLLRGSGLDGLATLKEDATLTIEDRRLRVLRPMLFASAEQVGDYARQRQLTWVEDPTNATDRYLRNRIRREVTPALRAIAGELGPARRTLINLEAERQAADDVADALERRARRPPLEPDAHAFDARTLLNAPHATCTRIILRIAPHFARETLAGVLAMLPGAFSITPKHLSAPGFLVRVSHGQLVLLPSRERGGRDRLHPVAAPANFASTPQGTLAWQGSLLQWSLVPRAEAAPDHPARPWRCLLPHSLAKQPLTLRGYRPGDTLMRLRQDGTSQTRKASTVFQAAQLGTDVRWCWPCIADTNNNLIWIAGLKPPSFPAQNTSAHPFWEIVVRPGAALSAILHWQRK